MQKNERIECEIESLAYGGRGVARTEDGIVVFVERGLPGARVLARVDRVKKRFAEAVVEQVLEPGPDAAEPFCPHFGACGGCSHQDLAYERQVMEKQRQLAETMERIGRVSFPTVDPLIPSPETRAYRNKMEFAFSGQGRGLSLGLKERASGRVLDVTGCGLMPEQAMGLVEAVREYARRTGLPAWDPRTGQGFWRHLVLRCSRSEGTWLAQLITTPATKGFARAADLCDGLMENMEHLAGVSHALRKSRKALAFGEALVSSVGEDHVIERLQVAGREVRYRISAGGFFQPNSAAAEKLYELVRDMAGLTKESTLADLYCGSGGVGLALAPDVNKVVGLDSAAEAVDEARAAAREAGLGNCVFARADLETGQGMPELGAVDVVVADPPRGGLTDSALDRVKAMNPERLVLVSCDPPALARDVARLAETYEPVRLGGVDLFPHTPHMEAVALLTRRA